MTKEIYCNYASRRKNRKESYSIHRSWEDARKYGFVSAGGDKKYSDKIRSLETGDRIWVYIPTFGYVGAGIVIETAKPAYETEFEGIPFYDLNLDSTLTNPYYENQKGADKQEYIVKIKWLKTIAEEKAIKGLFSSPIIICKPSCVLWNDTIRMLKSQWEIK